MREIEINKSGIVGEEAFNARTSESRRLIEVYGSSSLHRIAVLFPIFNSFFEFRFSSHILIRFL